MVKKIFVNDNFKTIVNNYDFKENFKKIIKSYSLAIVLKIFFKP